MVEEATWSDFEVEQSSHSGGVEDSLSGCADLGRVFQPSRPDAVFQSQQSGFHSGDQFDALPRLGIGNIYVSERVINEHSGLFYPITDLAWSG